MAILPQNGRWTERPQQTERRRILFRWALLNGAIIGLGALPAALGRSPRAFVLRSASLVPPSAASRPVPISAGVLRLRAVGDIMLAGPMGQLMARKGPDYPFAALKATLRQSDITFGNLECAVAAAGQPIPKRFNFRADPRMIGVLAASGFTIVSVANNHAWDYGRTALLETVRNVQRSGVCTVGAGASRAEAHRLCIVTRKGLRVGFLAYLGLLPALISESDTEPSLSMASIETIQREVRAARPLVDVLIVSLHDGKEGSPTPTPHQRSLARAAIDAGADLVIGHHPHVVEPMERYHKKIICYSLGNCVFSVTGRGSGAMLEATLSRKGCSSARLIPLVLGAQPHLRRNRRR